MTTAISTGAGFDSVQVSRRSNAGYATGRANLDSSDVNTYSEAYRVVGANAAEITRGARTRVSVQGDDTALAQFTFGNSELPTFGLTMTAEDNTFSNMITGLSDLSLGGATINAGVPDETVPNDLIALFSRQGASLATSTSGDPVWQHRLLLNCQVTPENDSFSFQSAASYTHTVTVNKSSRTAWGQLLSSAFAGNIRNTILTMTTQYRLAFGSYVGNNVATTFSVLQTPIGASSAFAYVESGSGTNTFSAATITDITGKVVTLSAAPASGAFVIIFYQFDEWE